MIDAIPKVTGEFAYSSDLYAAGMLWGHTLRSPHAHALVRSIDVTAALTLEGVHALARGAGDPGELDVKGLRPELHRPLALGVPARVRAHPARR